MLGILPRMQRPPKALDGAVVLYWATSEPHPFFEMLGDEVRIPIHGLAICRYNQGTVYKFHCDASWEVQNDSPFATVEEALRDSYAPYDASKVTWVKA